VILAAASLRVVVTPLCPGATASESGIGFDIVAASLYERRQGSTASA